MEFVKRIETLFRTGTAGGVTDNQLLEQFLDRRGVDAEDAFAALVDRHGAMVLRVCRHVLPSEEDAEDAAQATFLVLARRAPSISRVESLACWLHGVARRVAANVRVAHARRRALEQREGELRAAGHVVHGDFEAIENHDDWARLHDELGSLPRAFREPLILCYLDGLSQEQAAAQLRCPLGTVQSRLARGRAKLKTRLEKRGVSLAPVFAGVNQAHLHSCPAPSAWSEATVRLAMQFADGKGQAIAGAGAASVVLAEQIVRALVVAKLKLALAMILPLALLVSGAAALAIREPKIPPASVATRDLIAGKAEAPIAPEKAQRPQVDEVRTIRGIVRDEQGHPVAKAWLGHNLQMTQDAWEIFEPLDRIRERKEPFRDAQGKIVPPGALGKYFELKDQEGKWRTLHPADVRRYQTPVTPPGLPPPLPLEAFRLSEQTIEAIEKGKDVFQVRTANGQLIMVPLRVSSPIGERRSSANRTDSDGRFSVQASLSAISGSRSIRFASTDFSQQAIAVVHGDDPDGPVEITLRPMRQVRAQVVVKSKVEPLEEVVWRLYTVDQTAGKLDWMPAIGANGEYWESGLLGDQDTTDGRNGKRKLEMWMPAGHYKVNFSSDTLDRVVDVTVPAGNGPHRRIARRKRPDVGWPRRVLGR
jgi:RNA polymerase sigma factor (sigma-70 family)